MSDFKIGDVVICVEPNIELPEVKNKAGVIVEIFGDSPYNHKVQFFHKPGLHIWCMVAPNTKLGKLLAGYEDV